MQQSIKSIFGNVTLFLSLITFLTGISILFTVEQSNSYKKIDILNEQKVIILDLQKLDKKDAEVAAIQLNGKSSELLFQIQKLYDLHKFDLIGKYILKNSDEYISQLNTLKQLIANCNKSAHNYYQASSKNDEQLHLELISAYKNINNHISTIIFTNITYDKAKLEFVHKLALGVFVFIFISNLVFYKRLKNIYADLIFLQSPSADPQKYTIYSTEADLIYLRMNRKTPKSQSIINIDPVTGINNNKGLVGSYAEKKGLKESDFTALAILEIDNFSKTKRAFPQDFTQSILKKIASTISLYEQATDVIARSDYNEFTIILSRTSKEKAFKEIDQIRQSIQELRFVTSTKVPITITVSGGFYIKPNNISLTNAILETRTILEFAKKSKNKIAQKKDLTGVKI